MRFAMHGRKMLFCLALWQECLKFASDKAFIQFYHIFFKLIVLLYALSIL